MENLIPYTPIISVDDLNAYMNNKYEYALEIMAFKLIIKNIEEAKQFAELLQHKDFPSDFKFKLFLNTPAICELANALASGKCKQGLELDLSNQLKMDADIISLANALMSNKCPTHLRLNLSNNNFSDKGVKALLKAITSGKCPDNLTLDFATNTNIYVWNSSLTKKIIKALANKNSPTDLSLIFRTLNLNLIKMIAKLLTNKNCPRGLTLSFELNGNVKYQEVESILKSTLTHKNFPINSKLVIRGGLLYPSILNPIITELLETGRCQKGLDFEPPKPSEDLTKALFKNNVMHAAIDCLRVHKALAEQGIIDNLGIEIIKHIYASAFPYPKAADKNGKPLCQHFAKNVITFFNEKIQKKRQDDSPHSSAHKDCVIV